LESYIDTAHAAGVLLTGGRYEGRTEAPRSVGDPLRFNDGSEAIDWYEDSQRALMAAVHLASSLGWHAETWRLAYTLRTFLRIRHHTDDWMAVNDLGMAAACSLGDPAAQLRMHESICAASLQALRLTDCVESATRVVELAEVLGDRAGLARGHHLLGIAYDRLGQRDLAEQHLNLALAEQAYASGPDAILGYLSIGAIYGAQGRYDECRTALLNARDLAAAINDEWVVCVAHHNLAELCLLTGDADAGADHAREEISIARRIRFPMREARGNEILADCLMRTDPAAARQAWRRAIDIYDGIDPKLAEAPRQRLDEMEAATA
jgi:tetratricopeptide (TPR) repeat protein